MLISPTKKKTNLTNFIKKKTQTQMGIKKMGITWSASLAVTFGTTKAPDLSSAKLEEMKE